MTYLLSLYTFLSPSPTLNHPKKEPAPEAAGNSWQGLIELNLVNRRLSSQNQLTWNNVQPSAPGRRASPGSI